MRNLISFIFFLSLSIEGICQVDSPNLTDTLGLKQGNWVEIDTVKIYNNWSQVGISSMTTNGCKQSTKSVPPFIEYYVCKSKGKYINGSKSGIWKYFKNELLTKQVTFSEGIIDKVEMYGGKEKLYLEAVRIPASIWAHYKLYDGSGKEGDVPTMLLYSNSMEFLH
jgi:hypothetical protein